MLSRKIAVLLSPIQNISRLLSNNLSGFHVWIVGWSHSITDNGVLRSRLLTALCKRVYNRLTLLSIILVHFENKEKICILV